MTKAVQQWCDEVVVERIISGAHIGRKPTVAERKKAAAILMDRGVPLDQAARMAGMARRTLQKMRRAKRADTEPHAIRATGNEAAHRR